MIEAASTNWSLVLPGLALGLVLGAIHLTLLRKNTALYLEGPKMSGALFLIALRLVVAIGVFSALSRWSAAATVAALFGFSIASWSVLAWCRTD